MQKVIGYLAGVCLAPMQSVLSFGGYISALSVGPPFTCTEWLRPSAWRQEKKGNDPPQQGPKSEIPLSTGGDPNDLGWRGEEVQFFKKTSPPSVCLHLDAR